jgi:hypothetical protein
VLVFKLQLEKIALGGFHFTMGLMALAEQRSK